MKKHTVVLISLLFPLLVSCSVGYEGEYPPIDESAYYEILGEEYRAELAFEKSLEYEDWRNQYDDVEFWDGPDTGCLIKGNISMSNGEKIYHVPGQTFYEETVISPKYGERWFCTEAEAIAAGWRKAQN